MMWLISELHKRKVLRVAGSFIVGAYVAVQAAHSLEDALKPSVPDWLDTLVLSIAVIGFPFAVIAAWMFEFTPEGIKRAPPLSQTSQEPSQAQATDWILIALIVLVLAGETVRTMTTGFGKTSTAQTTNETQPTFARLGPASLVVWTFDCVSEAPGENCSDQVPRLIRHSMGKIQSLRMPGEASRAEAMKNRLDEAVKRLGVAYVLEGSIHVKKERDDILVKLVDRSEQPVWSANYRAGSSERTPSITNIVKDVATALKAPISEPERIALEDIPTSSPEAFDLYTKAAENYATAVQSDMASAQRLLEKAVKLDPAYAAAWALLSRTHGYFYANRSDATPERQGLARSALAKAKSLDRNAPEVLIAEAFYTYWVDHKYEEAQRQFEALERDLPPSADVQAALGYIARRLGDWDEAKSHLAQSLNLDALHRSRRLAQTGLHLATRDFARALSLLDDGLKDWPGDRQFLGRKALVYQVQGKLDEAAAALNGVSPKPGDDVVEVIVAQALQTRRHDSAIALVKGLIDREEAGEKNTRTLIDLNLFMGDLLRHEGDASGASTYYFRVRDLLRNTSADMASYKALVAMGLGDRRAALAAADQAVSLAQANKDGLVGAYCELVRAKVFARFAGKDKDRAITALKRLLTLPAALPLTASLLKQDPEFDKLRNEPAFKALMASEAATTPE